MAKLSSPPSSSYLQGLSFFMKVSRRRSICLWIVCPETGGVRKLRFSLIGALFLAFLSSFSIGTFLGVVIDYQRLNSLKDHAFTSFHAASRKGEELSIQKVILEEELTSAQKDRVRYLGYEESLRERLVQLEDVVRKTLTIDGREKRKGGSDDRTTGGIGGAEISCARGRGCLSLLSGENQRNPRSVTLPPARAPQTEDLLHRMDQYTVLLRHIPAGRPLGGEISSGYGLRKSVFIRGISFHKGTDYLFDDGKSVRVTADGVVRQVKFDRTYGKVVDVDHGMGIITRYAHLSKFLVKEGQAVSRGQILALGGSTGMSTGPHLHYEVRILKRPRNPEKFVKLASDLHKAIGLN